MRLGIDEVYDWVYDKVRIAHCYWELEILCIVWVRDGHSQRNVHPLVALFEGLERSVDQ